MAAHPDSTVYTDSSGSVAVPGTAAPQDSGEQEAGMVFTWMSEAGDTCRCPALMPQVSLPDVTTIPWMVPKRPPHHHVLMYHVTARSPGAEMQAPERQANNRSSLQSQFDGQQSDASMSEYRVPKGPFGTDMLW
ncbi:unnamed protein product [Diplocarpon coronariae]|uniref:Uncharacterized protein n=1 Tax=Diplocarpon coronariae TaxID=2795749 RepID=A0A218YYP3_9HELO|nr:hypothetical protein B2J93_774 [Marssonina coronariae]